MHNESYIKQIPWINFLKLRLSYGVTGNIYQGATSYMTATSGDINTITNLPVGIIESPANPNLRWEQSRTGNVGLDFSLLSNRLRGSIDYYNKYGKDIFSYMTLAPTTGFSSMFVNMASMRNHGVEFQMTFDWLRPNNKSWGWTTDFTLSYNKNKVKKVENSSTRAYQMIQNSFKEGYPTSALWSYRFAGISNKNGEKGMTLWYSDDNQPVHIAQTGSVDILEYSGQTEPKVIMGINNSLRWKGFSFNMLMAYYGGHVMRALQEVETFTVPSSAIASYFNNAWEEYVNEDSTTPGIGRYASTSIAGEPTYSNISVRKADFLKIRNIVLGYRFPVKWISSFGIKILHSPSKLIILNGSGLPTR